MAADLNTTRYCSSGRMNWLLGAACWERSLADWQRLASPAAAPPAPTGAVLTLPPADEADARRQIDVLINAEMQRQQRTNAGQVESYPSWRVASGIVSAAEASDEALSDVASSVWPSERTMLLIGTGLFLTVLLVRKL